MNNEQPFAHVRDAGSLDAATVGSPDGSARGKEPRIAEALAMLEKVRIRAMSPQAAARTLRKLNRIESLAASLMRDVKEMRSSHER